jgi:hypothetical protein
MTDRKTQKQPPASKMQKDLEDPVTLPLAGEASRLQPTAAMAAPAEPAIRAAAVTPFDDTLRAVSYATAAGSRCT